ncbi:hypothetical protein ASG37_01560 [Sphingomonas sp. Leaf407]|uniref:hypothetical protein n=1 Tax=unclassified Sphingomonas TaxID=196159 RepID=UPI0006F6D6CF|nr:MULTISPECIES: hypothetical protein [unclassified Sphingomonas]KQN40508.1 hypothetical protein ASE97_01585 [Sphingomonas sp. Leaf42]KQT29862.1 hypothetical protein ASG37_01560 [Sphingomonas sp. Leaf407]
MAELATLFRWRVANAVRVAFEADWRIITEALLEQGSSGSALFDAGDGVLCALARWPDTATRDRAFAVLADDPRVAALRRHDAEPLERRDMTLIADLWKLPDA